MGSSAVKCSHTNELTVTWAPVQVRTVRHQAQVQPPASQKGKVCVCGGGGRYTRTRWLSSKSIASKPNNLSSIPDTHIVEREKQPCKLSCELALCVCTHVYT